MKRYSFVVQLVVFKFGKGCGALLSLVTSLEINLVIVGAMFLISAPLHLVVIYYSKLLVYKVYIMPTFFVDDYE